MTADIPYGDGYLKIDMPKNRVSSVLHNKNNAAKSIQKLLLKVLRQREVPFRKKRVLIAVPDGTRNAHLKQILPILLEKISIPSRTIDILIATGLHKKHTAAELQKLLGSSIPKRHKVFQHDAHGDSVRDLGATERGIPITLNSALFDYDFIISIGAIEPHLYAGYSGGAKTIAIGLAGAPTINATHSIKFLDDPSVRIGSVEGNHFQETLWQILKSVPDVFSVNTVNSPDGKPLKIFAGPVKDVFIHGVNFAKNIFETGAQAQADIVICGIGRPKDVNLYQASRAINYVTGVDRPVVRKKGVLIIAAQLSDGIGSSAAEKRFYEELKNMRSPGDFITRVKLKGCVAGEHRAYMVAKALVDYEVIFVSNGNKSFLEGLPFSHCNDLKAALNLAEELTGKNSSINVIPHSLATIARVR